MSADITEERIAFLRGRMENAEDASSLYETCRLAIKGLDSLHSQLAALQSVPQGVEVPDLTAEDMAQVTGREYFNGFRTGYHLAKSRARLVPTPPQAAPGPFGCCSRCGGVMELSAGWMPSYSDPDNSGCSPMAEPYCPRCDAPQADAVVVPKEEWKYIVTLLLHLIADEDVLEDREKLGLPKTRKQRRTADRARRKKERREAWEHRTQAPGQRGEG